ncbi:hypothetical protein NUM3379_15030 [Kineococcus sp. NUM-3379]
MSRRRETPAAPARPARWSVVALAVYLTAVLTWWLLAPEGPARTFWTDFAYLPLDAAGVVVGVLLLRRGDLSRRARWAWGCIVAAVGSRFLADACWWWIEGVLGQEPFPSLADVFYSTFYLFLFAGVLLLGHTQATTWRARVLFGLDVLITGASAFVGMWYFVLGPISSFWAPDLAHLLNIYYPVADVVLLAAAARLLMLGASGSSALVLILLSCASYVVADTAFAYLSTTEGFTGGDWVDLPWIAAAAFLVAAIDARRRSPDEPEVSRDHRAPSPLPVVAVLGAGCVLIRASADLTDSAVSATAIAVVAVMSLTAVRQLIANRQYARLASRYRILASRDALTGAASRAEGMAQGAALVAASAHRGEPCSVLMMDMNLFKQINDGYGHPAGDAALVAVVRRITAAVREEDLVCRYGGDEFLVVLPGADAGVAAAIAARVEASVAATPVQVGQVQLELSVTAGAATAHGGTLEDLVEAGDRALLARKAARPPRPGAPRPPAPHVPPGVPAPHRG